jgi:hypothetical protein
MIIRSGFKLASVVIVFAPEGELSNDVKDTISGHGAFARGDGVVS